MKSIILEESEGRGVVLREDGTFARERVRGAAGAWASTKSRKTGSAFSRGVLTAAAMFMVFIGAGAVAYATPYYYASMDINPSVEVTANVFGLVIDAEGVNEDGAALLEGTRTQFRSMEAVMAALAEKLGENGYLAQEGNTLMISTAARNQDRARTMAQNLEAVMTRLMDREGYCNGLSCEAFGYDMVREANDWGMTPGKYNLVTNLLGIPITTQEEADKYINTPVRDLMQQYNQKGGSDENPGAIGGENGQNGAQNGDATQDQTQAQDGTGDGNSYGDGDGTCDGTGSDGAGGYGEPGGTGGTGGSN